MGGLFSEELIEEIKSRNDIVEVISQYIQVKSMGTSHKALCPFHNEKTPSFVINPQWQSYKCFGCGEAGDVIKFVMKMENLDFTEAVKLLAEKSNISLPDKGISQRDKESQNEKQRLYEIQKKAGRFYYHRLTKEPNPGLSYLLKRGLSSKTIKTFGLGYACNSWNDLLKYLTSEGYTIDELLKCGLVLPNKDQKDYYDRFRNRVMFPIFDVRGNVVGFGGRVLDDSVPKYLNSPETKVFSKSNTIYGLNFARKHAKNQRLLLVEGYMDVVSLYEHGIQNAVAALGTAFTRNHALLLKRHCQELIICFDGDTAGQKATLRSLDILQEADLPCRVIPLPKGMDPDEFVQKYGKFYFEEQMEQAISPIDYRILVEQKKVDLTQPEGKINFVKALGEILKNVKSPVEREVYIQKLEKEIGVSKEALEMEIYGSQGAKPFEKNQKYSYRNKRDNKYIEAVPKAEEKGHMIAERQLIKALLTNDKLLNEVLSRVKAEDFSTAAHQEVVEYIYDCYLHQKEMNFDQDLPHLQDVVAEIIGTDIDYIDIEKTLEKYIDNLKRYKYLYQLKLLQEQQNALLQNKKLNKEEVETKLLKIGMEIMKINTALQKR